MKKHYGKGGRNWSERRRVWRHPYIGRRFHDIRHGYMTITKAWKDRDFVYACRDFGAHFTLTFEYRTDGGLRFIEEGFRLFPNIVFEDGKLPDEQTMLREAADTIISLRDRLQESECDVVKSYGKHPVTNNEVVLYNCSKCGKWIGLSANYCSNCGARIRGVIRDG